jgi:FkbM family methyltransferase
MPITSRRQPHTFEAVEVVLIAMFVFIATATVTLRQPPKGFDDERPFRERYKGEKYSANAEEWLIRDFFKDRRGGVFVDVGANHYRDNSNTFFLETQLGWSGVAVDAQREFAAGYLTHRPRTTYVTAFVSDHLGTMPFYIPKGNRAMASSDEPFVEYLDDVAEKREVPTATLTQILDTIGLNRLDFLSMDIELAEPKALAGFDIGRFGPSLVCIEAHVEVRQEIINYFARHGYVVIGKYWLVDRWNMYFTPAAHAESITTPYVTRTRR